ncbi:hypothetical protein VNI00_003130 [Paramarasmius palmivorus]|uniref:ABM domain-containing protein n=1 Tax=Paramarasmius palmivorus TaxID=297713 RepID=A0AAW0DSR4_9AGAR
MATLPETIKYVKGKFILIATVTAKEGKADELQKHLAAVREVANSSQEPGTLTYRTARGFGEESNKFVVVEEYENPAVLAHHASSAQYLALKESGVAAEISIALFDEFQ